MLNLKKLTHSDEGDVKNKPLWDLIGAHVSEIYSVSLML